MIELKAWVYLVNLASAFLFGAAAVFFYVAWDLKRRNQ